VFVQVVFKSIGPCRLCAVNGYREQHNRRSGCNVKTEKTALSATIFAAVAFAIIQFKNNDRKLLPSGDRQAH
jgi:hypothetical protein